MSPAAFEGFVRLMILKEAAYSTAIETGEDPERLFHMALLAEAGVTGKDAERAYENIKKLGEAPE